MMPTKLLKLLLTLLLTTLIAASPITTGTTGCAPICQAFRTLCLIPGRKAHVETYCHEQMCHALKDDVRTFHYPTSFEKERN